MRLPLAFDLFGFQGILILAILGVLLYGERLPEVAASFARQFMELKKSVQGIRNEIESVALDTKYSMTRSMEKSDDSVHEDATAPKFELPPAEPAEGGLAVDSHVSPGVPPSAT